MTVFAKPSLFENKTEITKIPLVAESSCPETQIAIPPSGAAQPEGRRRSPIHRFVNMVFHFINISLVLFFLMSLIVVVFRLWPRAASFPRYQGYCAVPIKVEEATLVDQDIRMIPLQWSPKPELKLVSDLEDGAAEELLNVLREEIDIDGMIEKISVLNNGRQVNFIHDFTVNLTNIVDGERCFTMELDPETVLLPRAFVLSIERGGEFDVTRVRSALRAVLPALRDPPAQLAPCRARPTYRLRRLDAGKMRVRKRSTDAPPHDFVHFAGKHVHEIEIDNLDELLRHERNATE
ncbi:unnamed protein product, partial [Iphiclides podalirius]